MQNIKGQKITAECVKQQVREHRNGSNGAQKVVAYFNHLKRIYFSSKPTTNARITLL
jgi:hypothetical protein